MRVAVLLLLQQQQPLLQPVAAQPRPHAAQHDGSRPQPAWPYATSGGILSRLPVGWFGSNASGYENSAQLAAIGRYDMAIFGWQGAPPPSPTPLMLPCL